MQILGGGKSSVIHEMSYSFAIHSTTFLVKILSVDEFILSDGIVFEYDKLFLNKLKLGLGI